MTEPGIWRHDVPFGGADAATLARIEARLAAIESLLSREGAATEAGSCPPSPADVAAASHLAPTQGRDFWLEGVC